MAVKSPSEIARETLKLLATRRLAPTPDNYHTLYSEVSGQPGAALFPEVPLRQIMRVLPGQTRKYGISGAQPAELFGQALDPVWAETHKPRLITLGEDFATAGVGGGGCGCGGCGCGAR